MVWDDQRERWYFHSAFNGSIVYEAPPSVPEGWAAHWDADEALWYYEHPCGRTFFELDVPVLQSEARLPIDVLRRRDVLLAMRTFSVRCHPDKQCAAEGEVMPAALYTDRLERFQRAFGTS